MIFFVPYKPPTPPYPDNPPSHSRELDFGPFWSVLVRFGSVSVRFGCVWVHFGSVSGPSWGVGSGRGAVVEMGFCKEKNITALTNLVRRRLLAGDKS